MTDSTKVLRSVTPLLPPDFYTSNPPPHHTKDGFTSPWPSAKKNGFIDFAKARFRDWQEVPLPDANALPAVRPCTWLPSHKAAQNKDDILFTWLGHAGCHFRLPLVGSSASSTKPITILTDPVFTKRCSPVQFMGPTRFTMPPTSVHDMATSEENVWPDLLVISHNHYDHLSLEDCKAIFSQPESKPRPHVFCPLGLATWFKANMGIDDNGVTELDWWEERIAVLDGNRRVRLTCVPAQHFSGRSLWDRDQTLWAGWTFEALCEDETEKGKRVYFAGDTGYRSVPRGTTKEGELQLATCPAFKEIGEKLGPFDMSAIPIGAYLPRSFMSAIHMNPSDAVCAHQQVQSRKSIGIHWGSFRLTPEDVNEPPRKLKEETQKAGLAESEFDVMGIGETRAF